MKKKIFWWSLLLFWCGFIFYQSHKIAQNSEEMSLFYVEIIDKIVNLFYETKDILISDFILRKTAHFTEYSILGIIAFNNFRINTKIKNIVMFTILFCIIYAITDEVHQIFIPGRAGKLTDIIIDSLGGASGTLLSFFIIQRQKRNLIN